MEVVKTTLLKFMKSLRFYAGQKNRYSRDIHEIDPQCDLVISCDIDFDLQRELATRSYRGSRRCRTEARYIARYHMNGLWMNLMNFQAVTISLAMVVVCVSYATARVIQKDVFDCRHLTALYAYGCGPVQCHRVDICTHLALSCTVAMIFMKC